MAHHTIFPTIMIPIQMLTVQGDLSTGAENIIWHKNQTLLEEDSANLHLHCFSLMLFNFCKYVQDTEERCFLLFKNVVDLNP